MKQTGLSAISPPLGSHQVKIPSYWNTVLPHSRNFTKLCQTQHVYVNYKIYRTTVNICIKWQIKIIRAGGLVFTNYEMFFLAEFVVSFSIWLSLHLYMLIYVSSSRITWFWFQFCIQTSSLLRFLNVPSFSIPFFCRSDLISAYSWIYSETLQISLEKEAAQRRRTLGFWSFKLAFGAISFEHSSPAAISYGNNRSGNYTQLFSSQHSRVTAPRHLQKNIWLKHWIEMHSYLTDSLWCQTIRVLLFWNQEFTHCFKLFIETIRRRIKDFWKTKL